MRKQIAILLVLLFSLCMPAVSARADDAVYSEGPFYYTFADGSITIVGYFGRDKVVHVPASIAGYPVNAIAPGAFAGTDVEVIYLPDTIMVVGEGGTGTARVVYAGESLPTATPDATDPPAQGAATPKPTKKPGKSTPAPTAAATAESGHDETTVDDDAQPPTPFQPTATPEPTPEVTEAPTAAPAATEAPAAETSAPKEEKPVESTAAPTATPTPQDEPAGASKGVNWGAVGVVAAVLAGGGAFLAARKKKKES